MKTHLTAIFLCAFIYFSYAQEGHMHPQSQINFVKGQIELNHEPFLSAYAQLLDAADKALGMSDHALEDFSVPGFYQDSITHRKNSNSLRIDAFNAYATALAYRLGAGEKYGKKAGKLLHAWGETNKKYSDDDGPLVMTYAGTAMVIAAQLMSGADIWIENDQKLCNKWIINVYRKACNEIRNRTNNWADWGRFGSLLCAAYFNDKEEITENVRLIKSDLFHKIAEDGSMPEETRREKNGLWYTYFSLAPITAACWLVYNNTGENLFTWENNGVSLKIAVDYLFYYNQHPEEWKWYKNPRVGTADRWPGNLFEAMSGIYEDIRYAQYVQPNRPLMYPEQHYAWTFPTLMPLSLEGYK